MQCLIHPTRTRPDLAGELRQVVHGMGSPSGWAGLFPKTGEAVVLATCGDVTPLLLYRPDPATPPEPASLRAQIRCHEGSPSWVEGSLLLADGRLLGVILQAPGEPFSLRHRAWLSDFLESAPLHPRLAAPAAGSSAPAEVDLARLPFPPDYLPSQAPAMRRLYGELASSAANPMPVLLCGETGVGKEPLARLVHLLSPHRSGPFVAINCAAIPSELLEAEMFGIVEGAASGVRHRPGCFQQAQDGTLFLDEVGEMAPTLQAKLLRALQEREVRPVGGQPRAFNARVVAATNVDLSRRLADGGFRADLYYRLAGQLLEVPPLRQRREDLPELIRFFQDRFTARCGRRAPDLTLPALETLLAHSWPGNVRELEHEMLRLAHTYPEGEAIRVDNLAAAVRRGTRAGSMLDPSAEMPPLPELETLNLGLRQERLETSLIRQALEKAGSLSGACRLLGISRNGLKRKCRRLAIEI